MALDPVSKRKALNRPSGFLWLIATVSMILPWLAVGLGALGFSQLLAHDNSGWLLAGIGLGLLVIDLVIDLWFANPATLASDDPTLNCRGAQCIGRTAPLCEAIEHGRGKVLLGDTVWIVEGPEGLPVGKMVRVVSSNGTVLKVEAV